MDYMEFYKDQYVFTADTISKLIDFCLLNDIIYLQLFGSYTKEKATGRFRDIDLLIMFNTDSKSKDMEKINLELSNLLKYKADVSPMDYLSMQFKSSILDSKCVIYKNELYDNTLCENIEKVLRWYEPEGRRELKFLDESLEAFEL
jgi:predicted nucleotidyltransferase